MSAVSPASTLATRFRSRRPPLRRITAVQWALAGWAWLVGAGALLYAGANVLSGWSAIHAPQVHSSGGLPGPLIPLCLVTALVPYVVRKNGRIGEAITQETEDLLAGIPEADVRYEAMDARLKIRSVTWGSIEIDWGGVDVLVVPGLVLFLRYKRVCTGPA